MRCTDTHHSVRTDMAVVSCPDTHHSVRTDMAVMACDTHHSVRTDMAVVSCDTHHSGMVCSFSFIDRSDRLYSGCSVLQSMEGYPQGRAFSLLSFLKIDVSVKLSWISQFIIYQLAKCHAKRSYVNV